ncbi:polymer-forming cytoskeletal protein [Emticicia agri]|uniref:Uncharacterized protein n=1 Tax=Emticicia agri TaxID=2492393 RepID=A0A4Q5LXV2_9BACT|nr:polymer-forming cytoskeletal protein [Emticicia agri]RYU94465.1 hypothetical protein EWM59_16835 [Emticicia agri]
MKISTKLYLSLALSLSYTTIFAQNAKVVDTPNGTVISNMGGTDTPYSASILDIRSANKGILLPRMSTANRNAISSPQAGLLIYNNSTNQFNYHNGSSWQVASIGNQWGVNGSILHHSGQVGIGTANMINANTFLNVRGNLGGTGFEGMYITSSGSRGKPFYGYSANDSTTAYHYYDGSNSRWNLNVGSGDRITVTSTGNVGIGITNPIYKLHVNGSSYLNGYTEVNGDLYVNGIFDVDTDGYINRDAIVGRNLSVAGTSSLIGNVTTTNNITVGNNATVNGNGVVDGNLTVNNGKGVAYNASNSTNLRIYKFTTANFHAVLPAHGSAVTAIAFNGGFTSTPHVMVADIASSGGTVGEIDRVILVLSGCSISGGTTSCTAKIVNTDNAAVDYNITWNCIAIGY